MTILMIVLFVLGYLAIALEHKIGINKATVALVMSGILWTILSFHTDSKILGEEIITQLGDTCEILVYLIGAMTIVDTIEKYGGFHFITSKIKANNKRKLLWIIVVIAFFMSSILDNMTTTIIIVVFLNKLISDINERWLFAGIVVIAANSGGAWSPIGDVTTIMLWMHENVTSSDLIINLLIPSIVSAVIPTYIGSLYLKNTTNASLMVTKTLPTSAIATNKPKVSKTVFALGVIGLVFVPVFKTLTGLPPFMGMVISLGILWAYTEIIVKKEKIDPKLGATITSVVRNIDMPTILFFLGILMSVGALQNAGILDHLATFLDTTIHEPFLITSIIGITSSIVDNVPLVAACIDMYPVTVDAVNAYSSYFVQDGLFWHLLTYCAGVGGSLLIIGSAAGVVAMGLENISFSWYLKKISLLALLGYVSGILVIMLENALISI